MGGVAVSLVSFVAATWKNPQDYYDTFCSDDQLQQNDFLFDQDDSQQCFPYRVIDWQVFFFFSMGSLFLLACLFGYSFIERFKQSDHRDDYETIHSLRHWIDETSQRGTGIEMREPGMTENADSDVLLLQDAQQHCKDTNVEKIEPILEEETANFFEEENMRIEPANDTAAVWVHVRKPAIAIFLTFFVTLGLFPGWTSELQSTYQCKSRIRLANDLYIPFMFLLFNVGDLLGRLLSTRLHTMQIYDLSTKLVTMACLRFLFFPLLFLCSTSSNSIRFQINSDLYSELIQFSFALTNGFVLSAAFVHAPSLVPSTLGMQERMSEILNFSVVLGLLCGSLVSLLIASIVNT